MRFGVACAGVRRFKVDFFVVYACFGFFACSVDVRKSRIACIGANGFGRVGTDGGGIFAGGTGIFTGQLDEVSIDAFGFVCAIIVADNITGCDIAVIATAFLCTACIRVADGGCGIECSAVGSLIELGFDCGRTCF